MWSVEWDGGFVVGGDDNRRLTPNLRLKEFRKPDGTVRVHRELVTGLQMLRDRFGKPLAVKRTEPDGWSALVSGEPNAELWKAAQALQGRRVFERVEQDGAGIRVGIPDPRNLPPIELEQALETAFSVTAAFETAGDKFQQITGNFDAAGLSFGPAQVNFKSGTLVPLFREFLQADPAALTTCFGDPGDHDEWLRVMEQSLPAQIAWANGITTGRGRQEVVEPWKGYFQAVGRVPRFRQIMVESVLTEYGGRMLRAVEQLHTLVPALRIDHLRCICSLYDLVIQQGSLNKAWSAIQARVQREKPQDQLALCRIAVEERARAALQDWQDDACSRRLGILDGVPHTVGERQRANIAFYMLRDVRIRDAAELTPGNASAAFARVSQALGAGETLLA